MNLGPKSLIQLICREWVGKLGFNESNNKQNGSKWQENEDKLVKSKENHPRHSPRRVVLIYFSQVWLQVQSFDCYSVFLLISRSFTLKVSRPFYTTFPFHLHLPRVDQIVGIHPCPISTFLKSLGSSCKAES